MTIGDTEDDSDLYPRFTVSGFGPVVHEQEQDDVTIATKTQAQVERDVRDADDFSDALGGRNPDHDLASVRALIGDAENLRLAKGKPDRWEMASDWTITLKATVSAWKDLAFDQGKPNPDAIDQDDALEFLERASREEKNAGPNALHAALDLALDHDSALHTELLERYLDRHGPSREDFEDWLENQDEDDSDA